MKILAMLVVALGIGIAGCDQSIEINTAGTDRSDTNWYIADGEIATQLNGSTEYVDFTLIQKRSSGSVVSGFVLYDVHHRGYNMLIHRRTKTEAGLIESWSFHEIQNGKSEVSCMESLNDYFTLPATLRMVAWTHAPFDNIVAPNAHPTISTWTKGEIPVVNSSLFKLEQKIDRITRMPENFRLWSSTGKVVQMGKVTQMALIDQLYMPVSIKIVTDEQEVSVMLRNGAVLSNTESANGIEAYLRYIESPTATCVSPHFSNDQLKQL
ncbi:hypothetical protein [Marinobacter salarius]|uniref:Lipoprotein n=1 Tax=Marinobacter salarius TaxID=1420917 RepID=A0A1W6KA17_9GAMM|nr:hypothetical protein [Marinobacter salarius]ARM84268.1 hypothetical protein MARSALSMR5_02195 [Marinobacter salarius]